MSGARAGSAPQILVVCVLAGILALSLVLRLQEPLSSPQLGAEDPYTHLVFTKEHFERGYFDDSVHAGWPLYPPGLHVLVGLLHEWTGISLHALARFLPPVLGTLGVAGVFVVATRFHGLVAGTVAGGLLAMMPEHIFRTNLLFPSALDLALLPLYYWCAMELAEGHYAWSVPAILAGLLLTFSHPWLVPMAGLAAGAYSLLALTQKEKRLTTWEAALPTAAVLALYGGLGLFAMKLPQSTLTRGIFRGLQDTGADTLVPAVAIAGVALAALVVVHRLARRTPPMVRSGAGVACVGGVLLLGLPKLVADLPRFVNYEHMIGAPAILLAMLGLLLLPLAPNRLGLMGTAIVLTTLPLSAINVFDHPFWPHRTVVYVTIGVAFLAGGAAATLVEGLARAAARFGARRVATPLVAASLAVAIVAGSAAAGPAPYPWYRLYDDDSYAAFEWVVEEMEADPSLVVLSGQWQSNAVLKALGPMERVLYDPEFYQDASEREEVLDHHHGEGRSVYVLVGPHHRETAEEEGWDLSFLQGYDRVGAWGEVTIHQAPA